MPADMKHIPARITPLQRQLLEQAGPVGAAARALLWLGMAAAGLPLPMEARREILSLLAEDLASSLLAALQELADQLRDGGAPAVGVPAVVVAAAPPSPAPTTPALTPATSTLPAAIPTPEPAPPPEPAPRPHTRAELEQEHQADDPYGDMGFEFDG
jgi:hypothetical protein